MEIEGWTDGERRSKNITKEIFLHFALFLLFYDYTSFLLFIPSSSFVVLYYVDDHEDSTGQQSIIIKFV